MTEHIVLSGQREALVQYALENDHLKVNLGKDIRSLRTIGSGPLSEEVGRLQNQIESYARKGELEKKIVQEISNRLLDVEKESDARRQVIGQPNAGGLIHDKLFERQKRLLEVRAEKGLERVNKALAENLCLRDQMHTIRRERICFDSIYRKLEKQLQDRRKSLWSTLEHSKQAVEEKRSIQAQFDTLHAQAKRHKQGFTLAWEAITASLVSDRAKLIALPDKTRLALPDADNSVICNVDSNSRGSVRGSLSVMQEGRLKKRLVKTTWEVMNGAQKLQLSKEKLKEYESSFVRIHDLTGNGDIDDLIDKYIEDEDKLFSLFNYVNSLNAEIEKLEVRVLENKIESETLKGQDVNTDAQRKKMLRNLDAKLKGLEMRIADYEHQTEEALEDTTTLKGIIHGLLSRLVSTNISEELLGSLGVTESNMMRCLGLIEDRITGDLLNGNRLQHEKCHRSLAPCCKEKRLLTVQLPQEDSSSDDESGMEDDFRPLTREEFTEQINKSSSFRGFRKYR